MRYDSYDGAFWDDIWIFSPKSVLQHCSGQVGNYHLVPSFYPTINYDLAAFVCRRPIMIIFDDDDGGYLAGFDRSFHWARWLAAKILPIISADFAPAPLFAETKFQNLYLILMQVALDRMDLLNDFKWNMHFRIYTPIVRMSVEMMFAKERFPDVAFRE